MKLLILPLLSVVSLYATTPSCHPCARASCHVSSSHCVARPVCRTSSCHASPHVAPTSHVTTTHVTRARTIIVPMSGKAYYKPVDEKEEEKDKKKK